MTTNTIHAGPRDLATAYFVAWRARDAEALRDVLADDLVFDGPMGHVEGLEDNLASLRALFGIVTDVAVHTMATEDHADGATDVVTVYDLHTSVADPVPTANHSRVEHGRIVAIRALFDPRPLLGAG